MSKINYEIGKLLGLQVERRDGRVYEWRNCPYSGWDNFIFSPDTNYKQFNTVLKIYGKDIKIVVGNVTETIKADENIFEKVLQCILRNDKKENLGNA